MRVPGAGRPVRSGLARAARRWAADRFPAAWLLALAAPAAFAACEARPDAASEPAATSGAAARAVSAASGRGPYDVVRVESDRMVEMRDGVHLATDVYRPARGHDPVEERFPVLLHRTPYDKTSRGLVEQARWFATHGYVVVLQDTRGLYGSEGVFRKYHEHDAPDGFDTIAWIAGLDYVVPRVGMWGTSYGAHTQADAAKLDPPALATAVLTMGGLADGWDHKVRNHGAFELGQQLGWAHLQLAAVADDPEVRARLEREPVSEWFDLIPFRPGANPLSVAPNFEAYFLEMQNHGDYDDYWRAIGRNWVEYYEGTADIPMLHVGGWYDPYAGGTIRSFVELSRLKDAPMRLVMGPWTHGAAGRSYAGDVEFGEAAAISDFSRGFHLRWFDRHLKAAGSLRSPGGNGAGGEAVPAEEGGTVPDAGHDSVRIFLMGGGGGRRDGHGRLFHGGRWIEASSWPLPGTDTVRFHAWPDGSLRRAAPPADGGSTTYTFDPHRPVPTIGGSFSGALKRGAYDQVERPFRSLEGGSENGFYGSRPPYPRLRDRPDVLVFETAPLAEDVAVVGPITVRLWVSSSAVDTDFTAKLVDVYPPSDDWPEGFDMNLTDGILRARYRVTRERAVLLEPGEVVEVTIEPFPTANVFVAGHRIRLDISSSNYPRFDVNPNTGEPLGRHTRMVEAENTVYHDAARPSHVLLPLVPLDGR